MPHPTQKNHHPSPWLVVLCVAALLLSCTPEKPTPKAPPEKTTPRLLPAEISLADQYTAANRPDLALAVLAHHPDHPHTRQLLDKTAWHLPITHLEHPGCEIHHIAIHRKSLWVTLTAESLHTIIRWNLETLKIEAVLFPTRQPIRSLAISPTGSHAVITRGDVTLLIDAHSLKPIGDLGDIPTSITPESAIAFSTDSILLAHPGSDYTWHIRDTRTGDIIRSTPPQELGSPHILAAHLDRHRLRLLAADGTRTDIPVSPVEPLESHPFTEEPLEILHAHLIHQGTTAIIIRHLGPHQPPAAIEFDLVEKFPHSHFDIDAWAVRQSHSTLPGLATGLLRHLDPPPVEFTQSAIIFHRHPKAPLLTDSPPLAITSDITGTLATAEASGRVTLHQYSPAPENPTPDILTTLARHTYHPETAEISGWDGKSQSIVGTSPPHNPLHQRLAAALPSPTTDTPAHNLATALNETNTPIIIAILESAENLPPTLRTLATSHVHLSHNNTAAAFAPYFDGFPDIDYIRLREDWHGWEQPDFQAAVNTLESAYLSIIQTLTIDPEAEETARQKTIERLIDPATARTIGRARYAIACLDAAKVLITIAGEAGHAFTLATLARHHGAPTADCLRVEATALTGMGEYPEAHNRWIDLITNHHEATHQPGDYTEAAYTAFENDNPRQSIEILITGVHRFGHDPEFALRAAWIALLTGNAGQARAFLLKGQAAGFPEDSIEHATALLTIAAALDQDAPAANAHFQDLITIDPTWAAPETLDSLPWPEHLIAPLRQLTW